LLIPRKIRYVRDENVETDISIEFSHDLSIFDNKPNTLAQAYLYHPNNPPGYNGLIQFNDNHFFTPFGDELAAYLVDPVHYDKNNPQLLRTEAFLHILMHEGCHMMGYRHDLNSPESIMYPYAKHGYTRGKLNEAAFIWTEDDISRWEAGYGQRSLSSNWLNRLRARRLHGRFKEGIPYRLAV